MSVNSVLVMSIVLATLALGYVFYGKFLTAAFGLDPRRRTPAHEKRDGVDFEPARHWLALFGHHFSSICGAGPIVGPALAVAYWGWGGFVGIVAEGVDTASVGKLPLLFPLAALVGSLVLTVGWARRRPAKATPAGEPARGVGRRRFLVGAVAGAGGIVRDVGLALAKNPLVLSVAAGALVSAFGISIPLPLAKFFDLLSSAAGPCALFAIGLFISGQSVREGLHEAALITAIKLLVHPAIAWLLLAAVFEVEPLWATVTILIAALPTGANCFVLAQRYNVFVAPTSATILLSTALSVVTVSLLLILLR